MIIDVHDNDYENSDSNNNLDNIRYNNVSQ